MSPVLKTETRSPTILFSECLGAAAAGVDFEAAHGSNDVSRCPSPGDGG